MVAMVASPCVFPHPGVGNGLPDTALCDADVLVCLFGRCSDIAFLEIIRWARGCRGRVLYSALLVLICCDGTGYRGRAPGSNRGRRRGGGGEAERAGSAFPVKMFFGKGVRDPIKARSIVRSTAGPARVA